MFAKRDELKNDYIKNELTKKEKAVMCAIFNAAENGDGVAILKPVDILRAIPFKIEFAKEELEPTLKALELDEYIDFVQADKDGEKNYCVNLKNKGLNFARTEAMVKRSLRRKILFTILFAILGATISMLWKFVLSKYFG